MGPNVIDSVDTVQGLSSKLLRDVVHGVPRVGIGSESNVDDHIHALLDLLAWHHYLVSHGDRPEHRVQLVIGRGSHTDAALPAVRTLRSTHTGSPQVEILVESERDPVISRLMQERRRRSTALDRARTRIPQCVVFNRTHRNRLRDPRPVPGRQTAPARPTAVEPTRHRNVVASSRRPPDRRARSDGGYLRVGKANCPRRLPSKRGTRSMVAANVTGYRESLAMAIGRISELVRALERVDGELLDHGLPEHAPELPSSEVSAR